MLCYYKRWKFYSLCDYGHVVLSCNDLDSVTVTLNGYITHQHNHVNQGNDISLLVKLPHFYKGKWEI